MRRIFLLLCLVIPTALFSQTFINESKKTVSKKLDKYKEGQVFTTDTSLTVKSTEAYQPVEFIYMFDRDGKCRSEKVITQCDSCYNKYLQGVLARKEYGWKKLNENQYISNFASHMLIELPVDSSDHSFVILRTNWTKQSYELITGN